MDRGRAHRGPHINKSIASTQPPRSSREAGAHLPATHQSVTASALPPAPLLPALPALPNEGRDVRAGAAIRWEGTTVILAGRSAAEIGVDDFDFG